MADDQATTPPSAPDDSPAEPSSLKGLTMAVGIDLADPSQDPLLGRELGGVTIVRRIAEGGMGRVYEGLQENPRRPVAVKVIRPGFVSNQLARRFSLETEILARLQHPYIAQIYSAGMCDIVGTQVPFFVMEFIPDALPITRYADRKALTIKERLALFRKACEAVAHGHHNCVIHRDLKPSNILVDRSGIPKVIDFGVARCVDAKPEQMTAVTDMGQLVGTLQYMSPEQLSADPTKIDVRSDVYALGVVLYELLTGRRPYEISQQQIFEAMRVVLETKPVAPSSLNQEVQPDLDMIAGKCLVKTQSRRFADAAEIVNALERHLGGGRFGAKDSDEKKSIADVFVRESAGHRDGWRRLLPALALAAAVIAAGLVFLLPSQSSQRIWRFEQDRELQGFEIGGVVDRIPGGGIRLGNGAAYSSISTKEEFVPPIRVEYDVLAGPGRVHDIFPGLFVKPINSRSGIQYLFGDNGNTKSFVLLFGRYVHLNHEPVQSGRLYKIAIEIDEKRQVAITRDGQDVFRGPLPPNVELRGPVQCGAGIGNVTYKRLSISPRLSVPTPTSVGNPGGIALSGVGESTSLPGEMPAGWVKPGVFAEIRGAGEATFPRLPVSDYVLDIDVEFRNPHSRISFISGEPGSGTDMPLGALWPQDFKQDRVPCRLFRVQPWGVNWTGETHFKVNERLLLKLLVLDDEKALLWNGTKVLRATGNPADFCLRLVTTPETDATIHRLACRKPTAADATEAGLKLPRRLLPCDVAAATERLEVQRSDVPDDKPPEGRDFAIADKNLLFRWIEPGELILGDAKAPFPQLGSGQEKVRITRGYWLGAYEVTQAQWEWGMQSNPSRITGSPHLPVNGITWSEACRFCELLTIREREAGRCPDGYEYRLPTEAEWEWACRAGTDKAWTIPKESLPVRARYDSLVEVGSTPANPWGLHELLGNVPEWCSDTWQDYTGETESVVSDRLIGGLKGKGPFVVRGGGVWLDESAATSFARTKRHDIAGGFRGFRVALAPPAVTYALDQQLRAVFASLQSKHFKDAGEALAQAAITAESDRRATDRLQLWQHLLQYASEYPRFREKVLTNVGSGMECAIGGRLIAVVEVTPQHVIFRERGRNQRVPRDAIPSDIETAIMDQWCAAAGRPADHLVRGAAALTRQDPDAAIARDAWSAAVASGEPHGSLLLACLDDPVIREFTSEGNMVGPTRSNSRSRSSTTTKLEQKMTLVFGKETLERSIQRISEEIEVPIDILGADLQLEGITKNQSFGLQARDKTAREILSEILAKANPDGKLVYILVRSEAGRETIAITTRAAVSKRKDTLPPEFNPSSN
jgi:hypothetical protein